MNKPLAFTLGLLCLALVGDGFYFYAHRQSLQLQHRLSTADLQNIQLNANLLQARTDIATQLAQLTALDTDLGATKTRLSTADAHNIELTRETTRLHAQLTESSQTNAQLKTQINDLSRDLAASRASAAAPEAIAAYQTAITELKAKLADAQNSSARPATDAPSPLTAVLTTTLAHLVNIVSVGPSNAFVVLDYGSDRGAQHNQTMLIHRGTETLAAVLISDVREHYSIAQVRPDSLRGDLHKGDSAVLAH